MLFFVTLKLLEFTVEFGDSVFVVLRGFLGFGDLGLLQFRHSRVDRFLGFGFRV